MVKAGSLSTVVFSRALAVRPAQSRRSTPLPENEQIFLAIHMLSDSSPRVVSKGINLLASKGSTAIPFLLRELPERKAWYTDRIGAALIAIGDPVLEHTKTLLGECWEWGGSDILAKLPSASTRLGGLLVQCRNDILKCSKPDDKVTDVIREGIIVSARIISILKDTGCPAEALPSLFDIYKAAAKADEKNPTGDLYDPIIFETGTHAIKDPAEKALVRSGGIHMVAQILQDKEIPISTREWLATNALFRDEHHLKVSEADAALLIPLTKDPKLERCWSSIFQALARAKTKASAKFIFEEIKKGNELAIEVAWGLGASQEEIDVLIDLFLSKDLHRDHLIHLAQNPKNQVITRLTDEFLRRKDIIDHVKGNFFKILYRGATKEEGLPAFRKLLNTKKWQEAAIGGLAHYNAVEELIAFADSRSPLKTRKRVIWGLSCICRLGKSENVLLQEIEAMTKATAAFFGYLSNEDHRLRAETIELIRDNIFPITLENIIHLAKGTKLPFADMIEEIAKGYLAYLTLLNTEDGIKFNFDQSREIIEDLGKVGGQLMLARPHVSDEGRKQIEQFIALLLSFLQSSIEHFSEIKSDEAVALCHELREALFAVAKEAIQ